MRLPSHLWKIPVRRSLGALFDVFAGHPAPTNGSSADGAVQSPAAAAGKLPPQPPSAAVGDVQSHNVTAQRGSAGVDDGATAAAAQRAAS